MGLVCVRMPAPARKSRAMRQPGPRQPAAVIAAAAGVLAVSVFIAVLVSMGSGLGDTNACGVRHAGIHGVGLVHPRCKLWLHTADSCMLCCELQPSMAAVHMLSNQCVPLGLVGCCCSKGCVSVLCVGFVDLWPGEVRVVRVLAGQ
jgi:hypothetical protein